MNNLTYDNRNACCVPYESPAPGLAAQLQRLVAEERPGACVGCVCRVKGRDDNGEEVILRKKVCTDGPVFMGSEVVWE